MNNKIEYRKLDISEMGFDLLDHFDRHQEVNRIVYKDQDDYKIKEVSFVEEWKEDKKRKVIGLLRECVDAGGTVIGAFVEGKLKGFASVEAEFFGSDNQYLQLHYIHVSHECRGTGMGKGMFNRCCEEARRMKAKKLYISAHSAEETQRFYEAMGCEPAKEINQRLYDLEPYDIQLEYVL